jgi:hypothetical protein
MVERGRGMKRISRFTDKEINRWKKERNKACLSYDVKQFRTFYEKWRLAGIYEYPLPIDDRVVEITMRKMVYHIKEITQEQREEAKKWLEEHGYNTQL